MTDSILETTRQDAPAGTSYAASLLMVGAASAIALLLRAVIGGGGVGLLYLLPVLGASTLFGFRAGVVASLASAAAYNFLFVEPLYSLQVRDPANILIVAILLGVSLATSRLAGRLRTLAAEAGERAVHNETLVGFANLLLGCATVQEIADALCREVSRLLAANTILLVRQGEALAILAAYPWTPELTPMDDIAAARALDTGNPAGRWADRSGSADWTFELLRTEAAFPALIGFARDDGLPPIGLDQAPLFRSMAAQAALAIDSAHLRGERAELERLRERDRLRDALFSSVGHDLRTPLTSIAAAAAELREQDGQAQPLIATIESEGRRLDRLIGNLLDMSRLEAGGLQLHVEAVDLEEAVAAAADDVRASLAGRHLATRFPPDLPFVMADPTLIHHCLINLLDNAGRHAPDGGTICALGRRTDRGVELAVLDDGAGIAPGQEDQIFERFTRLEGSDRKGGSGLGLAIVKGFAEAMGFSVRAANRLDARGAEFVISIPAARLAAVPEPA